ncbi:hypothetical protein CLF_101406 [Clonorchis sinensis]|uniref:Uncharacterized protein n=1 Tax=Clonorchis sinensis TaxID=79923 RepID=G7Y5P1_CLOSI|nr:hypothetical protein CLF_101406 [Clonorchis sinensis]
MHNIVGDLALKAFPELAKVAQNPVKFIRFYHWQSQSCCQGFLSRMNVSLCELIRCCTVELSALGSSSSESFCVQTKLVRIDSTSQGSKVHGGLRVNMEYTRQTQKTVGQARQGFNKRKEKQYASGTLACNMKCMDVSGNNGGGKQTYQLGEDLLSNSSSGRDSEVLTPSKLNPESNSELFTKTTFLGPGNQAIYFSTLEQLPRINIQAVHPIVIKRVPHVYRFYVVSPHSRSYFSEFVWYTLEKEAGSCNWIFRNLVGLRAVFVRNDQLRQLTKCHKAARNWLGLTWSLPKWESRSKWPVLKCGQCFITKRWKKRTRLEVFFVFGSLMPAVTHIYSYDFKHIRHFTANSRFNLGYGVCLVDAVLVLIGGFYKNNYYPTKQAQLWNPGITLAFVLLSNGIVAMHQKRLMADQDGRLPHAFDDTTSNQFTHFLDFMSSESLCRLCDRTYVLNKSVVYMHSSSLAIVWSLLNRNKCRPLSLNPKRCLNSVHIHTSTEDKEMPRFEYGYISLAFLEDDGLQRRFIRAHNFSNDSTMIKHSHEHS